jgi:two-component system, chemotaxis family, sensor kinase Cph1
VTITLDLTTCDREPIHIPGAIQPHGVLLALAEPALVVQQASANLPAMLGLAARATLGQPLATMVGGEAAERIARGLAHEPLDEVNPLELVIAGARFDGVLHRSEGVVILELEPDPAPLPARTHHPLRGAIVHVQACDTLDALCETVVREIRQLTSFERVMVYQFDDEGHGWVRAELAAEGLEPYRGLHYPASDIPRQARELYRKNWLRIIPDARYTPVPVVPTLRPDTSQPLDLGCSVLRSVSPIHLEYLANMSIRGSMSVSLIVRGQLWGLISCAQHTGPKFLPYAIRSDCELLGRIASLHIAALDDRAVAARRADRAGPMRVLSAAMRAGEQVLPALLTHPDELLGLLEATGAAVVGGPVGVGEPPERTITCCGLVPPDAAIVELASSLASVPEARHSDPESASPAGAGLDAAGGGPDPSRLIEGAIFATSSLATRDPRFAPIKDVASGVASFALPGWQILWFRPEVLQTVSWGGDPRKPVEPDVAGTPRLHPRRSFAAWQEQVRLHSAPWRAHDLEALEDLRRAAIEIDLAKQVAREQRAVRVRDDLVAVVSHDLRNPLSLIHMQTSLLRAMALEADERSERMLAGVDRIQRSADRMTSLVNDLLDLARIESGRFTLERTRVSIREVLEECLVIMRPLAEAKRIALAVTLAPAADLTLALDRDRIFQVLSNLFGNAIKFTPEAGRIDLAVSADAKVVQLAITDTGPGIPETEQQRIFDRYWQSPSRQKAGGTGLGLYIARGIVLAHGGRIWAARAPSGGATFTLELPRSDAQ